jgi:hypothetical protein
MTRYTSMEIAERNLCLGTRARDLETRIEAMRANELLQRVNLTLADYSDEWKMERCWKSEFVTSCYRTLGQSEKNEIDGLATLSESTLNPFHRVFVGSEDVALTSPKSSRVGNLCHTIRARVTIWATDVD